MEPRLTREQPSSTPDVREIDAELTPGIFCAYLPSQMQGMFSLNYMGLGAKVTKTKQ